MINLYDVNSTNTLLAPDRWLGRMLRLPLRLIPRSMTMPILQGPGRGFRWIVGSYNHGCWLGSYEFEKQVVLKGLVTPGDVVYDVGAHVGFFTLILARLVGATGMVYSFEPLDRNYRYLLEHIALNGLTNVVAVRAAIGPRTGVGQFQAGPHSATGKLTPEGSVECPVYNLLEYIASYQLKPPTLIKMDIEGEEARVVPSILDYIAPRRVKLLVSTHSDEITSDLAGMLASRGYRVTPLQWAGRGRTNSIESATLLLATQ